MPPEKTPDETRWLYTRLILRQTHNGMFYCLTVALLAQFMYTNFHYILGACLTTLAVIGIAFEFLISVVGYVAVWRPRTVDERHVKRLVHGHFGGNHVLVLSFLPFLVWAVVFMFEGARAVLQVEVV